MTLYDIIADLRRDHPNPSSARALDMVVRELGRTRDNLREALANLETQAIPPAGRPVLEELGARAAAEGLDDLEFSGPPPGRPVYEPIDQGTMGIGVLMGGSALLVFVLAAVVVLGTLNKFLHLFG